MTLINFRGSIGKSHRNLTAVFTIGIFFRMLLITQRGRTMREIFSLISRSGRGVPLLSTPGSSLPQGLWLPRETELFTTVTVLFVLLESTEPNPGPSAWLAHGITHPGCLPFLLLIFLGLIFSFHIYFYILNYMHLGTFDTSGHKEV